MEQERIFYHGSIIGGLDTILANSKSHTDGSRVAYFTEDRVYALVCCRSRQENFVTMGPDRNGIQHYDGRDEYGKRRYNDLQYKDTQIWAKESGKWENLLFLK